MNNLWFQDTSILPPFDHNYEKNIFNKSCTGCSSRIHFNDTPYTLGFGHLFEGNCQSYQSYSYETPNLLCQQDSIMNCRVNKAMETIRKTMRNTENQLVSYQYNPNNLDKAAELLERAANAISITANSQNQYRL